MSNPEELKHLCYDERGNPRSKLECRAAVINKLIIDELMDIDDAEEFTETFLRELNLWKEPDASEP